MRSKTRFFSTILLLCLFSQVILSYPIDGYAITKIRRLLRLQLIQEGKIKDTLPPKGGLKTTAEIKLNLVDIPADSLTTIPNSDPKLQEALNRLFPNKDASYSVTVMDITEDKPIRFADWKSNRAYMPGSIGKLAILAGLFAELKKLYPDSFEKRQELLRTRFVRAGVWAIPNSHTVPFFDPETNNFFKRTVQEEDVFSLYEWADHMISVSSNAAASVLWKELVLMRAFGNNYPPTPQQESDYFKTTPKSQLQDHLISAVNDPLREIGITKDEWRLGSLFTRGAKNIIPGEGGSSATPYGLMKYLLALERGRIVDVESSLEIKRLMYTTSNRIRYATSPVLKEAAVYFKSGSLYKCKQEEGFECKKYMGNVENYMNSVIIVEQPDGTTYMVALMSNVLRKNSNMDHMNLATEIDKLIRK